MRKLALDKLRDVLLRSILDCVSIQEMFWNAYDCVHLPLNYFDTGFVLIANAFERPFYFSDWEQMAEHGRALQAEIDDKHYLDYQERMSSSGTTQLFNTGNALGYPQMCGPVFVNHTLIGYMGTMIEDADPEDAAQVNELIIAAIAIMERHRIQTAPGTFMFTEHGLQQFLLGQPLPESQLEEFLKRYPPPYAYIVLAPSETGISTFRYVQDVVCLEDNRMLGYVHEKNYLLIFRYGEDIANGFEAVRRILMPYVTRYRLFCSISDVFFSPSELKAHRVQAMLTLSLGTFSNQEPATFLFRDYFRDILCLSAIERFGYDACIQPELRLLMQGDKNSHALLDTLETHLACFQKVTLTAQQLNVHKNTVLNRLAQIEERTGLDMGDPICTRQLSLQLDITRTYERYLHGTEGL